MVGICFGMVSCQNGQENITGESTAESEQDAQVETRIEYIYELKYEKVEFLPESAKEAWREPLIKLLANACVMVNDGEDGVNFLPPNPDLPSVAYGVSVGLFDFDLDGVPEVIVNQGGGSSGNAFYTVYDLMTGEELGSMDGGMGQIFCHYYNRENGKYEIYISYCWRMGWMGYTSCVNRILAGVSTAGEGKIIRERPYLSANYSIDAVAIPSAEEDMAGGGDFWISDQFVDHVDLYVNGEAALPDDYMAEQVSFTWDCVMIRETNFQSIPWYDVCETNDSAEVRAEKMVNALLGLDQKFLAP